MPHLWTVDESGAWTPWPIEGPTAPGAECTFRRLPDQPNAWALLTSGLVPVQVNGAPVPLGLTIIADRDEIRIGRGRACFFSTESFARIEPYPLSAPTGLCPRCGLPIPAASPAVKCPGCGLWHHASDELGCWTYAEQCAECPQETALDTGFRWTPEEL